MTAEGSTAVVTRSVTQLLAEFLVEHRDQGLPADVAHEGRRVLLQGLTTTLEADDHSGTTVLRDWAAGVTSTTRSAHLIWTDRTTASEDATLVNAAQWYLLQLDPMHSKSGVKPVGQAAAAALAEGEVLGTDGRTVLNAMMLALETGLVITTSLQPSSYRDRGFTHMSLYGAVAAASASSVIRALSPAQTTNALGLAMISGGAGLGEQVGFLASALNSGMGSRAGVVAAQLAASGADAPTTAFDGQKGMLHAYSTESIEKTIDTVRSLGSHWRSLELSYQLYRGDSTAPALLDCVFAVLKRVGADRRGAVEELHFTVNPLTKWMAEERYARWGAPQTDLRATGDMPFLVASAWLTGRADSREKSDDVLYDPEVLALRDRVTFASDERVERYAASLEVRFTDGTTESTSIEAFEGAASNPISDERLEQQFLAAAEGRLSASQAGEIIDATRGFLQIDRIADFVALLRIRQHRA